MVERTVTEYDPRRPRIPTPLAAEIDAARGQVSFNRWVVTRLADALSVDLAKVVPAAAPPKPPKAKAKAKPKAAPARPAANGRPAISSAKAGMFSKDQALAQVREKHASRRRQQSQRREEQ